MGEWEVAHNKSMSINQKLYRKWNLRGCFLVYLIYV